MLIPDSKVMFVDATNKYLSSQCNLAAQIEQVQDKYHSVFAEK
jgi:hypothetical protein